MAEAGINTERTYFPPGLDLLDAFAENGIKAIVGFPYNDIRVGSAWSGDDIQSGGFANYISAFKNHPAILMWEFGNEYNYHPEWFGGNIYNWYDSLERAAQRAHSIDPNHPISSAHGGLPDRDVLAMSPSVDVWGANIYDYTGISNVIKRWPNLSEKPLYISETGIDSYNDALGRVDESAQAQADLAIWNQIDGTSDINSGLTFMTWQNETWKSGNNSVQNANGIGNLPSITSGDRFTEEYWGFIDVDGNPKQVYHTMQNAWKASSAGAIPLESFKTAEAINYAA